jgi:hypothetical protein
LNEKETNFRDSIKNYYSAGSAVVGDRAGVGVDGGLWCLPDGVIGVGVEVYPPP